MSILNNKKHFLHEHLTYIESIGKEGRNDGFSKFLEQLGIATGGNSWNDDHSTINWDLSEKHFQFFFDYENNEEQIKNWLKKSPISEYDTLLTWLSWKDPIIRIKTTEFIENWEEFNIARAWQGIIVTTEDGKFYLEFTDDWKFHLNSNFEIKPGTEKIKPPFNEEFCNRLESRLCKEFAESKDTELKNFWCDGVSWFTTDNQMTKKHVNDSRKIITKAWIGKDGQDEYLATIHFGKQSLSNYAKGKELIECIPESETNWIEIDIVNKSIDIKLN